jgi:hypothetical protein
MLSVLRSPKAVLYIVLIVLVFSLTLPAHSFELHYDISKISRIITITHLLLDSCCINCITNFWYYGSICTWGFSWTNTLKITQTNVSSPYVLLKISAYNSFTFSNGAGESGLPIYSTFGKSIESPYVDELAAYTKRLPWPHLKLLAYLKARYVHFISSNGTLLIVGQNLVLLGCT